MELIQKLENGSLDANDLLDLTLRALVNASKQMKGGFLGTLAAAVLPSLASGVLGPVFDKLFGNGVAYGGNILDFIKKIPIVGNLAKMLLGRGVTKKPKTKAECLKVLKEISKDSLSRKRKSQIALLKKMHKQNPGMLKPISAPTRDRALIELTETYMDARNRDLRQGDKPRSIASAMADLERQLNQATITRMEFEKAKQGLMDRNEALKKEVQEAKTNELLAKVSQAGTSRLLSKPPSASSTVTLAAAPPEETTPVSSEDEEESSKKPFFPRKKPTSVEREGFENLERLQQQALKNRVFYQGEIELLSGYPVNSEINDTETLKKAYEAVKKDPSIVGKATTKSSKKSSLRLSDLKKIINFQDGSGMIRVKDVRGKGMITINKRRGVPAGSGMIRVNDIRGSAVQKKKHSIIPVVFSMKNGVTRPVILTF